MMEVHALFGYLEWPVTVLVGLVLFIYLYGTFPYWRVSHVNVPYTKPWPWIGNLPDIKKYGELHKLLLAYQRKHGRVFKLFLGRRPVIVVSDVEMLRQIMIKDFNIFHDRVAPLRVKPPLSSVVLLLKGEDWKRVRNTITPSFTSGKLKKMVPLIGECNDILMERLREFAKSGKTVDAHKFMRNYALDVILSVGLGTKIPDLQTNPDPELLERARVRMPWYVRFNSILPFPWVWALLGVELFPGSQYFVDLVQRIIDHRLRKADSSEPKRNDVIDLLLSAHLDVEGSKQLTTDEVIAQSMAVLLAGQETTTNTFSFVAHSLAKHPDVQDRLLKEIDAAWANRGGKSVYELIHDVPYLNMVVKEVLRIYPPAFYVNRCPNQDTTVNGVHFPANVEVGIPIYVVHRDPDLWPEPEKFDPERFAPEAEEKLHPCQYIPFGAGPRHCIGMRLALLEIKATLLNVLREFRLEAAPETPEQVEVILTAFTLAPKGGVNVRVKKRSCVSEIH